MQHRPLFIRLCEAFTDNLGLILRIALVCGAIVFVDELGDIREQFAPAGADTAAIETLPAEPSAEPERASGEAEPWLSDGVRHALNCTHTEYRNRHYDECVQEPSDVYRRPDRNAEDDIGFLAREDLVLYARLEPVTPGATAAD